MHNKLIPIVKKAGLNMLDQWDNFEIANQKDELDFATNVDIETENFLKKELKIIKPGCGFICEESGISDTEAKFKWVIDPLDGTRNYSKHFALFNISIALLEEDEIIFGMVYCPATHELFYAEKGKGAYLNRIVYDENFMQEVTKKISVSDTPELRNSYLHIEYPLRGDKFNRPIQKLQDLIEITPKLKSIGAAAQALCYTAMGVYDGYVNFAKTTKLHDFAAGILIIQEAGGMVTNPNGDLYEIKTNDIVCSNGIIHNELLKVL
ncbi:hypothetical protein KKG71_05130 [Patescibacteria group bacterium]|nr:hypothetical protein [Patescibacteria group bacterium]